MKNETIHIQDLTNRGDVKRVESIIREVWGVRDVHVNEATGEAQILFDEKAAALRDFEQAIIDAGFRLEGQ